MNLVSIHEPWFVHNFSEMFRVLVHEMTTSGYIFDRRPQPAQFMISMVDCWILLMIHDIHMELNRLGDVMGVITQILLFRPAFCSMSQRVLSFSLPSFHPSTLPVSEPVVIFQASPDLQKRSLGDHTIREMNGNETARPLVVSGGFKKCQNWTVDFCYQPWPTCSLKMWDFWIM